MCATIMAYATSIICITSVCEKHTKILVQLISDKIKRIDYIANRRKEKLLFAGQSILFVRVKRVQIINNINVRLKMKIEHSISDMEYLIFNTLEILNIWQKWVDQKK